mgnify:CR=1 FL=1
MCRDACVCPRLSAGRLSVQGKWSSGAGWAGVRGFGVFLCILGYLGVSLCVSVSFWVVWCIGVLASVLRSV